MARVQSQGVRRRVATEGWVVAGFVHRTSREGDPQLHSHCLVPNLVRRAERRPPCGFRRRPAVRVGSGGGVDLPEPSAAHPVGASGGVLGAGPEQHPGDGRLHPGPAAGVLQAQRPDRGRAGSKGAVYESPALRMQADDEASLATRTAKDHSLTPSLLAGRWQRRGRAGRAGRSGPIWTGRCAGSAPVGAAGLGRDHRRPGRSGGGVVLPVGPLHQGGRGRAHLRHLGRPAVGRGDHCHGRAVRRLRSGGAPDPRSEAAGARAGPVVDRGAPGAWRTAPWL